MDVRRNLPPGNGSAVRRQKKAFAGEYASKK
jgi:hypothetical protein